MPLVEKIVITGKQKLSGEIPISGSKNSAVAILPATILAKGKFRIENVPDIDDIGVLLEILRHLGAEYTFKDGVLLLDTSGVKALEVPYELSSKLRASYYFLGALLGRFKEARVAMPGGCSFGGVRPIDLHLMSFEALGAVTSTLGNIEITLNQPSVGATINAILTAVRSNGTTIIKNASTDDYVKDLVAFLVSKDANIEGAGTSTIKIAGCKVDSALLSANTEIRFDKYSETATANFLLSAVNSSATTVIQHAATDNSISTLADVLNRFGADIKGAGTETITIGPAKADKNTYGIVEAKAQQLTGNTIRFQKVSVGATINAMIAAVLAEGTTIIKNAAKEPHIVDVANFLNSMGADIKGAGFPDGTIKITGVKELHPCDYTIIPDQIEAGTYLIAAAVTGSSLRITHVTPQHLQSITQKLMDCGFYITSNDDCIDIMPGSEIVATNITTSPHPGLPTDMQPQFTTLLSLCNGMCIISDSVWDGRFRYAKQLTKMGANITVNPDKKGAIVTGVPTLKGAEVKADDLRAGAAMVIAGLCAEGETIIENIHLIDRGYERMVEKLTNVGAKIERRSFPD